MEKMTHKQDRRSPREGGSKGAWPTQLFDYWKNWRIYSFKNLDSVLLAQIVFKYNKQRIA